MKKRSPRRRPLRASFVVTAAMLGCGGQVADPSPSGPDAYGSNPPAMIPDARIDAPTTCPSSDPTLGAPCGAAGLRCDYSTCVPSGGSGKAYECIDGAWTSVPPSTCNPPTACPTTEPTPGAPCTTSGFGVCSYADTCSEHPGGSDTFHCAGTWQLNSDYTLPCPSSLPTAGTPCRCGVHATYSMCSYCGPLYGSSGFAAECDATTGTWKTTAVTCNPPFPPDAGPDVAPIDAPTD